MPSLMGLSVLAAECAIAAEPAPASLENTARLTPITMTPKKPPYIAVGLKAPVTISCTANGKY